MGRIAIACYKPKPGRAEELKKLAKAHHAAMLAEDLVTDRQPVLMQSVDGTVVEVFEWRSKEAIEAAHSSKAVQKIWGQFAEVSDYLPIGQVSEGQQLFSEFEPL